MSRLFLHLCLSADGTLKKVSAATSDIAVLQFCFRSVLHEHLLNKEHSLLADNAASVQFAKVGQWLKDYVHNKSHAASAHLQNLHCFGKELAQDDSGSLEFMWSKDGSTVMYSLERTTVEELQHLIHQMQATASKLLTQLCLLADGKDHNCIDLARVRDHLCNTQPGFNVASALPEPLVLPSILCCVVVANAPASKPLLDPYSRSIKFNHTGADVYFALHNEFTKLLAVLIELSSGLPARGTELVQLQHTNTLLGPRNIFVHDGCVFTALPTNKGTGWQKIIPRFLPHAVGCLVVIYVCQVVPFVHMLYNAVVKPREASAMLLVDHAGKPWDTSAITDMLKILFKQHVRSKSSSLTISTWRQLAISIDRKLIHPKKITQEELEDHAHDLQAGHSTSMAEQHYGLDAIMLHQLMQESMEAMLEVSEQWHAFWKLRTRYQEAVARLAPPVSARFTSTEPSKAINSLKCQMDTVEEDLHCIKQKLEHAATPLPQADISCGRSAVISGTISQALFKVTSSYHAKMVEQAYALNAIHRRESPLIVVMATRLQSAWNER